LLAVDWKRSAAGWRPLNLIDLCEIETVGAYFVWAADPILPVSVGSGVIADRIHFHQFDPVTQAYGRYGRLHVTWATVATSYLLGVERYLLDQCRPLMTSPQPKADAISVNLPFAAN
jgi:hypothetical protein